MAVTAWAQLDDSVWPMHCANYATNRAVVQADLPGPSGRTMWTTTADLYGNPLNPGGGASSEGGAVIDSEGYIYYKSNGGTATMVYKLDPVTGAVVAQANLGAASWANRGAPVVGAEYLYVNNRIATDIQVLRKSDLTSVMTIADPNMPAQSGFQSVALGSVPNLNGNLNIYGYSRALSAIYAFDSVTGALMWQAPISPYASGFGLMGPFWVSEGKQVLSLLLGNGSGNPGGVPIAIRDNGDNTFTQLYTGELISVTFGVPGALSADGSRIYYLVRAYSEVDAPSALWAVSTTDGSVVWSVPPEELPVNSLQHASPAVVGNRVYVCGAQGWVAAVDDLGGSYSVAWTLRALHAYSFVSISAANNATNGETYLYASMYSQSGKPHYLYAVRDYGTYGETVAIKEYACPLSWSGDTNTVTADGSVIQLSADRVIKYAPGTPPVADAGEDTTFQASSCAAGLAVLDGSGSYDPDGTLVRYLWREGLTTIADVNTPMTHVKLPAGTHYLTLTVFDNEDFVRSDEVAITIDAQRMPPPVDLRLDEQINHDPSLDAGFDAITVAEPSVLTFESEGIDGNVRVFLAPNEAFEGPYINLNFACYEPIDLSAPGALLHFNTRYYRESGYADTALSARLRDVNGAAGDFGVLYGPQPDPRWPAWQTITTQMVFASTDPGFDLTQIAAVEFYGTNGDGTGRDFVDVKDLWLGSGTDLKVDVDEGTAKPLDLNRVLPTWLTAQGTRTRPPALLSSGPSAQMRMQRPAAAKQAITTAAARDAQAATAVRQPRPTLGAYNTAARATPNADAAAVTAESGVPLPLRVGGDTCEESTAIGELPFTDSGETCAYTDDYFEACPNTEPRGRDVVYYFIPPRDLAVDISLCNSAYDTKVYVYVDDCPGAGGPVACNDDTAGCGPDGYRSRIDELWLTGGRIYYIVIDGWSDACGQYELTVSEHPTCVIDPYLDALDEAEPDCGLGAGGDQKDGGCNGSPALFIPIEIGSAVWGTVGTNDADHVRDTDWYVAEIPTAQTVTWRVVADFDVQAFIMRELGTASGSCDYEIVARATGGRCAQVEVTAALEPGVYYFWVGPNRYTGVPCGAVYQAELFARMGACCFMAGGCQEFMSAAGCLAAEGFYRGDGSTCAEANCCEIDCPPDAVPEDEPCGENMNGGCDTEEFGQITCGVPICGTAWATPDVRDTDWYQFTLEEESQVTLKGRAQFPLQLLFLWHNPDDPCGEVVELMYTTSASCQEATLSACLAPGLYSAWAGPAYWFDLPCPARYVLEMTCAQPCATGACCFPLTEECVDGLTASACAAQGGGYAGDGTLCADNPCLNCEPGDTLEGEPPCYDGYIDTYNGGCNSQPPVFQPIACGETICGAGGTFDDGWTRDTDWYEVQITEPMILTWHIEEAEFNLIGYIIKGTSGCSASEIIAGVSVPAGGSGSVGAALEPGVYWLWIGAAGFFEVIPCGLEYRATLECAPYVPPGCPENTTLAQPPAEPDEAWTANVSDRHPGDVIDYGVVLFSFRHEALDNFAGVTEPVGHMRWWGINAFADWGGWYTFGPKQPDDYIVRFYTDNGGLPGEVVCEYTPLTPSKVDTHLMYQGFTLYEYTVLLEPPCVLPATGWVSVQGLYAGQDSVFLWMSSNEGDGQALWEGPTGHIVALDNDLAFCFAPPPPVVPGDVNCDGAVNFGDINPFVLILTSPDAWQVMYPDCPMANGDIDGDGDVDFGDINPFVTLLSTN